METQSHQPQSHATTQNYQDRVLSGSESPADFPEMNRLFKEFKEKAGVNNIKAETHQAVMELVSDPEMPHPNSSFNIPASYASVGSYDSYVAGGSETATQAITYVENEAILNSYDTTTIADPSFVETEQFVASNIIYTQAPDQVTYYEQAPGAETYTAATSYIPATSTLNGQPVGTIDTGLSYDEWAQANGLT